MLFDYRSKLSPLWTYAGLAIVIAAAVLVESSLTVHEPFVTSTLSQAHYPDDLFEMPMTDDELKAYFDVTKPNHAVDVDELQAFLLEASTANFMASMCEDGRAQKLIDNGYTSSHSLCELKADDLIGMGFFHAHAKKLATYLGECDNVAVSGAVKSPQSVISL